MTRVWHTVADWQTRRRALDGRSIGFVPTMGALHRGHASLVERCRAENDIAVVSIFVNPSQFNDPRDLERYPRTLESDLTLLESLGADDVLVPAAAEVYPSGYRLRVEPVGDAPVMEAALRPGHMQGVMTIVLKLLGMVRPCRAYFGEKDYQQLVLIKRMVRDLDMGIDVVGVETVRERDGLALSSRNGYLSADERTLALTLSRALRAGRDAGELGAARVLDAATTVLGERPELAVDYLALRAADLGPAPARGDGRLLVAARVGPTRLIDNMAVAL